MRSGRWKWRSMDAAENQRQVSLRAHRPWKSQPARFPHSHRPDDEAAGKVQIQKQDSHFPTGSNSLIANTKERRPAAGRYAPGSRLILCEKQTLTSGSSLDENMLGRQPFSLNAAQGLTRAALGIYVSTVVCLSDALRVPVPKSHVTAGQVVTRRGLFAPRTSLRISWETGYLI